MIEMKSVALERPSPLGAIFPKAKQPRNPGRREASMLEHALKQPGGSQMRKQMRSTFRIPGTEDGRVAGNAPRSGGAEHRAPRNQGLRMKTGSQHTYFCERIVGTA